MKEAGLPTPANAIIRRPSDLAKAARAVGFPAVIKPTSGAASLGVIRVDNEPDLHRCARANREMSFACVHIIMCC